MEVIRVGLRREFRAALRLSRVAAPRLALRRRPQQFTLARYVARGRPGLRGQRLLNEPAGAAEFPRLDERPGEKLVGRRLRARRVADYERGE